MSMPPSRRDFIKLGAAGMAGSTIATGACRTASGGAGPVAAGGSQELVGDGRKRRILLRGGVVLSLDPNVGDFERADVLTDGKTIARIGPSADTRRRCKGRRIRSPEVPGVQT